MTEKNLEDDELKNAVHCYRQALAQPSLRELLNRSLEKKSWREIVCSDVIVERGKDDERWLLVRVARSEND